MSRHVLLICFLFGVFVFALATPASARPKTDVVILRNGDRITCEIKNLTRGKIQVKTDSMGTLDIEWLDVVALKSEFYFRVEASTGKRFFGLLELEEGTTTLRIASLGAVISLEKINVVEITPIQESFWQKIDGSLSVGYSYTRASEVAQFTFDWSNRYVGQRNLFDLGVKSTITDKGTEEKTTQRIDGTFSYVRLLKKKWTANTSVSQSRNDELDLKSRFLLTTTTGVSPIKNNHDILLLSAGVAGNVEQSTNDNKTESIEGVLLASYSRFNYNTPKTDIKTEVKFYPSLTESSRYRFSYDLKFRREIVSDLFLDLSYYLDYDSKASSGEGQKRDYGIVTSVGWSY